MIKLDKILSSSYLVFGIIFLVSFAIFGNGISGDFVFDDNFVIDGNPLIGKFNKIPELLFSSYHFKQPETGLYRPITIISYSLNQLFFGLKSSSFHVVNIFLHILATFYLFKFLIHHLDKRFSALSAFIFLLLPIHVEAVTSIVGRAELLMALFVILGLYFRDKGQNIKSYLFFFLALLSKETAIAFLPIIFFLDYYKKPKDIKNILLSLWPYLILTTVYFIFRYAALETYFLSNDGTEIYNPIKGLSLFNGLYISIKVLFLYVFKTILPITLSSDYSFNQISTEYNITNSIQFLLGFILLILTISLIFYRKYIELRIGSLMFLAPFFIISNLIFKTGTIMAERLMYLPSVGVSILLAFLLSKLANRKDQLRYLGFLILIFISIFYSYKIIDRNRDWLTEEKLFMSAYEASPKSVVNMTNHAYLFAKSNDLTRAREIIDQTLRIAPEHIGSLNLAGRIYELQGDKKKAYEFWLKTIDLKPTYIRGIRDVGRLEYEFGNYQEAELTLKRAVDLYPRVNEVFLLSLTKTKLIKYKEAIDIIIINYGDNPEDNNLKFALGLAYYRMGDKSKADFYFNQSRNPDISEDDFLRALDQI